MFTRAGGGPLGAVRGVVDAAFSAAVVDDGENSPLIEIADGHALILRVTEHRPVRLRPMEEVRTELEAAVRADKAATLVAERGAAIVEQARGGGDLGALLAEAGVTLRSVAEPMGRNSDEVPPEVLAAIFRTPHPGKGAGVIDGAPIPGGGYAVFRVDEVIAGNPEEIPREQRDGRKGLLARQVGMSEVGSLAMDLRRDAKVVVAPNLFEKQEVL
jgi:peptidyl-prolyl cis-trans isomerase D